MHSRMAVIALAPMLLASCGHRQSKTDSADPTLKNVEAAPPPAYRAVISNVPSITTSAPAVQDRRRFYGSCVVMLHNTSSSAVLAYASKNADRMPGFEGWRESGGSPRHPLIAPKGDACDDNFDTIAAAVFSDGSYEGDPELAARLYAKQIGQAAVNRLAMPVIGAIVHDQSLDDDARTARIKDAVFRIQPDSGAARTLRRQFPRASAKDLAADLTQGFDFAKDSIWGDLYGYMHKCCEYPPPEHVSIAEWWRIEQREI